MNIADVGDPEEKVRLRELAQTIHDLVKAYDVGALVNLQGKKQSEWIMEIEPTWSCIGFEERDGRQGVRFRARLKTGTPNEKENASLTVGLVLGMITVVNRQKDILVEVMKLLATHMVIEHVEVDQDEGPGGKGE
jgi:hypothetical protein